MSAWLDLVAALLVIAGAAGLTLAVALAIRSSHGPTARHYANLGFPCGLLPVVVALALRGPYGALGTAALIVLVQLISSAAESHTTARLGWIEQQQQQQRRDSDEPRR